MMSVFSGLALAAAICAGACAANPEPARLGDAAGDYARLGLAESIQIAEDGMRTDGGAGTFEWWYFDGHLKDGAKLVIVFFTKPMTEQDGPLNPFVTIHLDYPDGRRIERSLQARPEDFRASKEQCDVRIGPHYFRGDLKNYEIKAEIEDVRVDLKLESQVEPFRPATGHFLFGTDEDRYFAWLAAVPRGKISGSLTIDGETRTLTGSGYHDHNWGNIGPHKAMNNWYWARAELGDYTVITSYITAEERYSHTKLPIFMLAHKDRIIASEGQKYMVFAREDRFYHEVSGKPIDNTITSTYSQSDRRYRATFQRRKNILDYQFVSRMGFLKRALAYLVGFDGAYHRFVGDVELEVQDGERTETLRGEAIWELMYFGRNLD